MLNSQLGQELSDSSRSDTSHQPEKEVKMVSISQDILIEILEENKFLKAKVSRLEKSLLSMKNFQIMNPQEQIFDVDRKKIRNLQKIRDEINDENVSQNYERSEDETTCSRKMFKRMSPKILNVSTSMNTERIALHTAKNSLKHCKNHLNMINREKQKFKNQLHKLKKLSRSQERMINSMRACNQLYY
ncbi:unnamed protein product [Moneuplotes crassus]|uniref:Uncharacterized protein n=1 Tax=Euplotes crassus TaxID=5936 RepID=A0AAD1XUK1_EUPCR|nr:unnamed protein product [Moneuplotes crassus]